MAGRETDDGEGDQGGEEPEGLAAAQVANGVFETELTSGVGVRLRPFRHGENALAGAGDDLLVTAEYLRRRQRRLNPNQCPRFGQGGDRALTGGVRSGRTRGVYTVIR